MKSFFLTVTILVLLAATNQATPTRWTTGGHAMLYRHGWPLPGFGMPAYTVEDMTSPVIMFGGPPPYSLYGQYLHPGQAQVHAQTTSHESTYRTEFPAQPLPNLTPLVSPAQASSHHADSVPVLGPDSHTTKPNPKADTLTRPVPRVDTSGFSEVSSTTAAPALVTLPAPSSTVPSKQDEASTTVRSLPTLPIVDTAVTTSSPASTITIVGSAPTSNPTPALAEPSIPENVSRLNYHENLETE